MNVAIELPDDIARQLEAEWQDVPRRASEAMAVGLSFWCTTKRVILKSMTSWLKAYA